MDALTEDDILTWCDENLPDLYDPGMFDEEETADAVWDAVTQLVEETLLAALDDDGTDRDALAEQVHDAAEEWFRDRHTLLLDAVPVGPPDALLQRPQTAQHGADWYSQRAHRLTASEFSQVLDGRRAALLRSKLNPPADADRPHGQPTGIAQPDGEMNATTWGHRFERLTRQIYELEIAGVGTVCDTLGRFQHLIYPWLSASPDGVVLSGPVAGRLVEIKSPKTRQPGIFVPADYYAQMQVQMEVCDIDAVDFIEAQFAQRPTFLASVASVGGSLALTPEETAALQKAPWKGRIQVYGFVELPDTWRYRYTVPVEDLDDAAFPDTEPAPADLPLLEDTVWWLTGWHPRTVLRNAAWWDETGWPAASEFWAEVESRRSEPPPSVTLVPEADTIELIGGGGWAGRRMA
jgi:hypothetical protein